MEGGLWDNSYTSRVPRSNRGGWTRLVKANCFAFTHTCPRRSDVFVLRSKGKHHEPGSREFLVRENTCDVGVRAGVCFVSDETSEAGSWKFSSGGEKIIPDDKSALYEIFSSEKILVTTWYIYYMQNNTNKKIWFKAKNYGWGWYPVSWQGWVLVTMYIIALLSFAFTIDNNVHSNSDFLINYSVPFIILTSLLLFVCYIRGEKPEWRWGRKK